MRNRRSIASLLGILSVVLFGSASAIAAPGGGNPTYVSDLPNLGEAPELHDGQWLNTDEEAIYLEDLRGSVVLLEMWTFGCINCQRTIPSLIGWHNAYSEDGLVILGNHYPEFDYEANVNNVRDAIQRFGIPYPVLIDNDRETWAEYNNRYWPTLYLIDKWGNIRYKHIGEGAYGETDEAIKDLLRETYVAEEDLDDD